MKRAGQVLGLIALIHATTTGSFLFSAMLSHSTNRSDHAKRSDGSVAQACVGDHLSTH
jgi:hypothetical protein